MLIWALFILACRINDETIVNETITVEYEILKMTHSEIQDYFV